jgi:hypothetical protein
VSAFGPAMGLGSWVLRCGEVPPASRWGVTAEEAAVMQVGKRGRILEVRVRFEASRIGRDCLAGAYEQIVPIIRRSLALSGQYGAPPAGQTLRQAAGVKQ